METYRDLRLSMLRLPHSFLRTSIRSHNLATFFHRMAHTAAVHIPKLDKTINVPTGLFINNKFVPSVDSQERIEYVIHPIDKRLVPAASCFLSAPSTPRLRRSFALL